MQHPVQPEPQDGEEDTKEQQEAASVHIATEDEDEEVGVPQHDEELEQDEEVGVPQLRRSAHGTIPLFKRLNISSTMGNPTAALRSRTTSLLNTIVRWLSSSQS